jgi:hypothetical protein
MPKLRLKVTHTHAGVAYPAGHVLEVDDYTARWLVERDIGVPVVEAVPPAPDGATDAQQMSAAQAKPRHRSMKE